MKPAIEVIKRLRNETGAGIMECRKALEQSNQNWENAVAYLHEKALAKAGEHAKRETLQGKIELYSHGNGRIGVMVEINTETDYACRSEAFLNFAREIALQITATYPLYVRDEDIPQQIIDEQAGEAADQARRAGKPERIIEQIVQGRLEKYKNSAVLLRQGYIRDESITIAQLLSQAISQIGENIVIRRFVRWEIYPDAEGSP